MKRTPAPAARTVKPDSAAMAALLEKGRDLHAHGRFAEAEHCFQLVLRDRPGHPEALNLMGLLALEAERYDVSIELLEKAVRASPKSVKYRNNLANSLILANRPEKALPHLRKALAANPRRIELLMNMGRAQSALGKGEDAEKAYRRALHFRPGFEPALAALGDVLVNLGRMDEAAALFRETLAANSGAARAAIGLSAAKKFARDDPDGALIEAALKSHGLDTRAASGLNYAMGKVRLDQERTDEAFAHFAAAKKDDAGHFGLAAYRTYVDRLIGSFDKAFFVARPGFGSASEKPVFIVGMPRSGTTLTEQVIASHPQAAGAGELPDIEKILHLVTGQVPRDTQGYFMKLRELDAGRAAELAEIYLSTLNRHARTAARVADKMPHNFQFLGLVALLFPKARIVHCRRDPMDTCVSCYTHHFNEKHAYAADLETLGRYYREYDRLMAHWAQALPLEMFELPYEQMVADQEGTSRRLIGFLGLDWDDACLRFHETERQVATPSRWQVRQPVYASSVKRWTRYEAHLGALKHGLGDLFAG